MALLFFALHEALFISGKSYIQVISRQLYEPNLNQRRASAPRKGCDSSVGDHVQRVEESPDARCDEESSD